MGGVGQTRQRGSVAGAAPDELGRSGPQNEQAAVVHDAVVDAQKRARWAAVSVAKLGIRTC